MVSDRNSFSRRGADAILPVGSDKPEECGNENKFDREMEAVEDGLETGIAVPGCAEFHADPRERVAPWPRADKGIDVEAELVHLCDAGRKGDEGADDGQHAADENSDGTVSVEEAVDKVKIAATEEEIAAVAFDHGASAACADPIGRDRAKI